MIGMPLAPHQAIPAAMGFDLTASTTTPEYGQSLLWGEGADRIYGFDVRLCGEEQLFHELQTTFDRLLRVRGVTGQSSILDQC